MELNGKKVIVFGLARSGIGAANLLSLLGAEVTVTDRKSESELTENIEQLSPAVRRCLGRYPSSLNVADMIVVSPGVPLDIEPLIRAKEQGIKIIGEFELAYQAAKKLGHGLEASSSRPSFLIHHPSSPAFLAVTGTNGKSTTATLLDLMMRKGGYKTLLGGNIGNSLCEEIFKILHRPSAIIPQPLPLDFIVAEVSSFQLESIDFFKPKGAAILNITPDHLDRYKSLAEYRTAKAAISINQDERDFLVLNADDPEIEKVRSEKLEARSKKPDLFYFSRQKEVRGVYSKNGIIYCNFPDSHLLLSQFKLIKVDAIKIKGVHNLENAMASAAMALLAGCSPDAVSEALIEFPGLEHRLEFVREVAGVRYINDSKGTNVGAVIKSLEGFTEPVILIAGGRDKAGDFGALKNLVKEKVKALVLIGEAAAKINSVLGVLTDAITARDLKHAVLTAREKASAGDVVLLSPACASFDMFKDFEDRGRQFKDIVKGLS